MRKILTGGLAALILMAPLAADDFDFGDLMAGGEGESTLAAPSLEIGGSLAVPFRLSWGDWTDSDNWDGDAFKAGSSTVSPDLKLDLAFSSEKADFKACLNVNEADLEENLFDELSLTWYGDRLTAALGWQKVVWGKGDKVHVLDLLNPMDYTDFLNPDYLDRKIAQPMINLSIPHSLNGKLELVYVPLFQADELASEGNWVMNETRALVDGVTGIVTAQAAAIANPAQAALFLSAYGDMDAFLPDASSLEYGQAGTRLTATLGQVDLGAVYYIGRYRTPSVVISGASVDAIAIDYDPLQVFGLEAGMVLGGFNLRGEGAYYMTEDWDGTDAAVHNPSLNYVAGFDRDLPLHNVNLNLQVTGSYRLYHGETDQAGDIEADADETETTLVCNVSDSFNHEKVEAEVTLTYRVEDQSAMIKPSVDWNVDGNLTLTGSGSLFLGGGESFFGQFSGNDYLSLEGVYSF